MISRRFSLFLIIPLLATLLYGREDDEFETDSELACRAVGAFDPPNCDQKCKDYISALRSGSATATRKIIQQDDERFLPLIQAMLDCDRNQFARLRVEVGAAQTGDKRILQRLANRLKTGDAFVQTRTMEQLGQVGGYYAVELLEPFVRGDVDFTPRRPDEPETDAHLQPAGELATVMLFTIYKRSGVKSAVRLQWNDESGESARKQNRDMALAFLREHREELKKLKPQP